MRRRFRLFPPLPAVALPTALVVSLLVSLMVLFAFSAVDLDVRRHVRYRRTKQRMLDLRSAMVRCAADSLVPLNPHGEPCALDVFGDGSSVVQVSSVPWGLYEVVRAQVPGLPFGRAALHGMDVESPHAAALWVCDRKRPLTFGGGARVEGKMCMPSAGINYATLSGMPFSGEEVPEESLALSTETLPPVRACALALLDSLRRLAPLAIRWENAPGGYRSFHDAATLECGGDYAGLRDAGLRLSGRRVFFADRLVLGEASSLDGILLFARKVVLDEGFRGNLQLFCTDTVLVRPGAVLHGASGIFVRSDEGVCPYVHLAAGASVTGYVVVLSGGRPDQRLEHPCLRMAAGARLCGLLYVDGACQLEGMVSGAAYLRDSFYTSPDGRKHPGALCNAVVRRDDAAPFPLLLEGAHRRRELKKVF